MPTQPAPLHFTTLDQVHAVTRQTSAQELLNGQIHHNAHGWIDCSISPELHELIADQVSEIAGGRKDTRARVWRCLMHERPQHWAIGRVFVEKYNDEPAELRYCAGQDYIYEMSQLRRYLGR